jgi:hypothetical protein
LSDFYQYLLFECAVLGFNDQPPPDWVGRPLCFLRSFPAYLAASHRVAAISLNTPRNRWEDKRRAYTHNTPNSESDSNCVHQINYFR